MPASFKPHIHRTETVRPHTGGAAVSIDEFIESECATMDAEGLRGLRGLTGAIMAKLLTEQGRQHHDLHQGVKRLVAVLESDEVAGAGDPLPQHLAEAGVAARYILKGADIIPDWMPEIGLTDDARVVARVLARNPELGVAG